MQEWISKLRERNVLQYFLLYAGFIWGLVQVIAFMSDTFGWPVSLVRVVTIIGFSSIPSAFIFFYFRAQPSTLKRQAVFYFANGLIVVCLFIYSNPFAGKIHEVRIDSNAEQSIAVLPFDDMSPNHDQDWFSDGVMTEIVGHLYKIKGWRVTPRNSSMKFKGKNLSPKEIAEALGVSHVLEGNVRRDGDLVRIQVTLLSGSNETEEWSETYNRDLKDILGIQSDVAQRVAERLKINIEPDVKERIEYKSTNNPEAYILVAESEKMDLGSNEQREALEKAILVDPEYGEPYAKLAFIWLLTFLDGKSSYQQIASIADSLNRKALTLDPNNLTAHHNLIIISVNVYWDFETAEKEYLVLKELSPSYDAWMMTLEKMAIGQFRTAQELQQRAVENDRTSPSNWSYLALTQFFTGDKPTISEDRIIENFSGAHNAMEYLNYVGNFRKSVLVYEKALIQGEEHIESPNAKAFAAIAYNKVGQAWKGQELLNQLLEKCRSNASIGSPSYFTALVYAAKNEREQALSYLEQGLKNHDAEMYWVKVQPFLKSLHGEPRYEAVVKKVFEPKKRLS